MAEHNLSEPTDIQVSTLQANLLIQRKRLPPRFSCNTCNVNWVQVAAYEEVLRGGDVVLASHTGSGKTLAYLLPLVRRLMATGNTLQAPLVFVIIQAQPRAVSRVTDDSRKCIGLTPKQPCCCCRSLH
jgi:superfamily II DNA/RNA helicase